MKWISIFIFLSLLGCTSIHKQSSEFWDDSCLITELHPCGKKKLNLQETLSSEDTKILMCRINALVKCRIKKVP